MYNNTNDEKQVYYDFARGIKDRLIGEVNGLVTYEAYPQIDTVIFKIEFKEFKFSYPLNEIMDKVHMGSSDLVVDDILEKYKKQILRGFFKSDYQKSKTSVGNYVL